MFGMWLGYQYWPLPTYNNNFALKFKVHRILFFQFHKSDIFKIVFLIIDFLIMIQIEYIFDLITSLILWISSELQFKILIKFWVTGNEDAALLFKFCKKPEMEYVLQICAFLVLYFNHNRPGSSENLNHFHRS